MPIIGLKSKADGSILYVNNNLDASLTTFSNTIDTPIVAPLEASISFMGGVSYSMQSHGLSADLNKPTNKVLICGQTCVFDRLNSD